MLSLLASGLAIRIRVIQAIILREIKTRFGDHGLGYTWAFVEPLTHVLVFLVLFKVGGRHVAAGMTMETFLLTGVIPWLIFINCHSRVLRAVQSNKPLLVYPMVTPLDFVVGRVVLEVATYGTVFTIMAFCLWVYQGSFEFGSLIEMIVAIALLALLGAGLGMAIAGARCVISWIEQVTSPLLRLLYFVSGIFFTLNEVSSRLRDVILYNPVAQLVDLVRDGFFAAYHARHASFGYPVVCVLVFLLLGLLVNRATQAKALAP